MPYAMFEICTVPAGDDHRPHRGVRIKCGHCPQEEILAINTSKGHGGDDEVVERMVSHKFESKGWKVGKTASQHRCPQCFTAIKAAAKRRQGEEMSKVVPIINKALNSTTALGSTVEVPRERPPTRDERRIIIAKMQEIYVNETVGYRDDWSDEKVSKDMGVPQVWVAQIRDETFGPHDINEQATKIINEARELAAVLCTLVQNADAMKKQLDPLLDRAVVLEDTLKRMAKR
jgi:predicted RNA-binding Zn-ribbon protein involved in translation (DUF1610 family)